MQRKMNKKGFTIVELVIVIAVIAVLAAVLIPTFVSLIKKANESVDMQIVKQMNTVLQTEEISKGKPATIVDAKAILTENGCDDFTPNDEQNVFYWIGADNRVIIWEKDEGDGVTTGKVTYPKELAEKYEDVTTVSADWFDLSVDYDSAVVEVVPSEGESVGAAVLNAIKNAEDGAILKLPENATIDIGGDAYWVKSYLQGNGGVGKSITIDLNGGSLISDQKLIYNDIDYGYYGITVPANGELVLVNGNAEITTDHMIYSAFNVDDGASLVLRDVKLSTNGSGVWPSSAASEVVLEGCEIIADGAYGLGTTRGASSNVRISVKDSKITSNYSTGMLINCSSDVYIENSTITGVVHAVAVRAGHLEIKDSTLVTTDTEPGIYSYKAFAEGFNFGGWWKDGNKIPAGTLVVGDFAEANDDGTYPYSGDVVVEMANTKIQSAAPSEIPTILMAASDPAKTVSVQYDDLCTVGDPVIYGSVWTSEEAVTFSHPGTITVNGETKTLN